jgi:hypothetical protein
VHKQFFFGEIRNTKGHHRIVAPLGAIGLAMIAPFICAKAFDGTG